jgi:hypothetical protein
MPDRTAIDRLVVLHGTDPSRWSRALHPVAGPLFPTDLRVRHVNLSEHDPVKAHGITHSLRIEAVSGDGPCTLFLKAPDEALYAETLPADRAREVFWRPSGYDSIPGHARAIAASPDDQGLLRTDLRPGAPLILVEEGLQGTRYADRMTGLRADTPEAGIRRDSAALAAHLAAIHAVAPPGDQRALYARFLRDGLVIPSLRLIDGAQRFGAAATSRRAAVEHALIAWRITLDTGPHRLTRIHLDYHPWNLFLAGNQIRVIGARLPGYGDPADDLACLLVNHAIFGAIGPPDVRWAHDLARRSLVSHYIRLTGDDRIAERLAPFFLKRLLVFLSPHHYPDIDAGHGAWIWTLAMSLMTPGTPLPPELFP